MVNPARALMPCTPMNTASRCNERSAATATGPTSASDGVRTPPVSTTVRSLRCAWCSTSATRTELVTTVRSAMSTMWYASCQVVVPAVMPMALPGSHRAGGSEGDGVLLAGVAQRLGLEAGLVGAALVAECGSAVHLGHQAGVVEHLEVAAHGHVADAEQRGQLGDAHRTAAAHLGQDHLVALAGECPRRPEVGGCGGVTHRLEACPNASPKSTESHHENEKIHTVAVRMWADSHAMSVWISHIDLDTW